MKSIAGVVRLSFDGVETIDKDKHVVQIFEGARRKLVEVWLRNGAILTKHRAAEPITVLCLSGSGVFRAGPELQDEQKLIAGTLVTLESEVEHEVAADPEVHILVTKFKEA